MYSNRPGFSTGETYLKNSKFSKTDFAAVAVLHSHYTNVAVTKWTAP